MTGKFGDLGFRILGLLFAAAGIAAFVIDPGRGAASKAFLIFGGLFLFAIPSLQWRISYSRSKRHFDRSESIQEVFDLVEWGASSCT